MANRAGLGTNGMFIERGRTLARLRKAKAMTQQVLADAAGVRVQTVKRGEAGRNLSPETVMALCAALGTTPAALAAEAVAEDGHGATTHDFERESVGAMRLVAGTADDADRSQDTEPGFLARAAAFLVPPAHAKRALEGGWLMRNYVWAGNLAVAALLEAVAWSPLVGWEFLFRTIQVFALAFAAAAAGSAAALGWFDDGRATFANLARTSLVAMAPAAMVLAILGSALMTDLGAEATFLETVQSERQRFTLLVQRMAATVPNYDSREDRFYISALGWSASDSTVAPMDSLGTYKAWEAKWERCKTEWRDAPTYDREGCEHLDVRSTLAKWPAMWRALAGGDMGGGRDVLSEARTHFSDKRLEKSR